MEEALPLCHICLRVDRPTRILEQTLADFLHSLCDTAVRDRTAQFCLECEYQLSEFYRFKGKCVGAATILQHWKRTQVANRKPINTLHTLLPPINLCQQEINKVHLKQETDYKTKETETSSTVTPEILKVEVEVNSINSNLIDKYKSEPDWCTKGTQSNESEAINTIDREDEIQIKLEKLSDESDTELEYDPLKTVSCVYEKSASIKHNFGDDNDESSDDDDDNDNNHGNEDKSGTERNDSLAETKYINKRKRKSCPMKFVQDNHESSSSDCDNNDDDDWIVVKETKRTKLKNPQEIPTDIDSANTSNENKESDVQQTGLSAYKKAKINKAFSIEKLKKNLSIVFENCEEVKSADGIIIERDVILNSLDKWPMNILKAMWSHTILGSKTEFHPQALKLLAQYQKRFEKEYSIFDTEYLNTEQEVLEEFLQRKTLEGYVKSRYKCELCYQGFKKLKALENHERKYHDPSAGDVECDVCHIRMKTKMAVFHHKNQTHKVVFRCKLCPLVTYYRNVMINHSNKHEGCQYTCETCKASFKTKSTLMTHLRTHKSQIICQFCAKSFVTAEGLDAHTQRNHKDEVIPVDKGVPCGECSIKFISSRVYERHRRRTHGEVDVKEAKVGGSEGEPRKKRTFRCHVCKASGDSFRWQRAHMLSEHPAAALQPLLPKKHVCDVCGKGFSWKSFLEQHRNVHTGARPFACDKCPATFHMARYLQEHAARHLPPRWRCDECGKEYATQRGLTHHIKEHRGELQYTCKLCPATFKHDNALRIHTRRRHRLPRAPKDTTDIGKQDTPAGETPAGETPAQETTGDTPAGVGSRRKSL